MAIEDWPVRPKMEIVVGSGGTVGQSGQTSSTNFDPVERPEHYNSHPSGVECITITEHYGFNIGNAIKYLWRAGLKGDTVEDLKKAVWYINREIQKRSRG